MTTRRFNAVLDFLHRVAARPLSQDTDAQLLRSYIQSNDPLAFETLYRRHARMVLNVCRKVLRDPERVEDAFQATFLLLIRKAQTIVKYDSVGSWLYGVAYRTAVRARANARQRDRRERADDDLLQDLASPGVAWNDMPAVVHEEIERLPDKLRAAVVLCYLEGKTNEEAAKQLRWPVGTVKGRLFQARELLRTRLTRRGLGCAAAAIVSASTASATMTANGLIATTRELLRPCIAGAFDSASVPDSTIHLLKGVLYDMHLATFKRAILLFASVCLTSSGLIAYQAYSAAPPPARVDAVPDPFSPTDKPPVDALPAGVSARFGTPRWRHSAPITSLVYAPSSDNPCLISAAKDGTVRMWDAKTGKELRRFGDYPVDRTILLALSTEGSTLASVAQGDNTIRLWDANTGKLLRTIDSPDSQPNLAMLTHNGLCAPAFAPDGKTIAWATSYDSGNRPNISSPNVVSIRVWETSTGKELHHWTQERRAKDRATIVSSSAHALAFAPDGKTLALALNETNIKLPNGFQNPGIGAPGAGAGGGGGGKFQGGGGGGVGMMGGMQGGIGGGGGMQGGVGGVGMMGGGMGLPTFNPKYSLALFAPGTGKRLLQTPPRTGIVQGLSFSPDSSRIATASDESPSPLGIHQGPGMLRLWNTATGTEVSAAKVDRNGAFAVTFRPDGKVVAVADLESVSLWQANSARKIGSHRLGGRVEPFACLAFSPDGKTLASGGQEAIRFWDGDSGVEKFADVGHVRAVGALAFSDDGQTVMTGGHDGQVRVWDADTGKHRLRVNGNQYASAAALAPNGQWVAAASPSGPVDVWDARSGSKLRSFPLSEGSVARTLAVSPDSRLLLATYMRAQNGKGKNPLVSERLLIGEATTGRVLHDIPFTEAIFEWTLSGDGKWIAYRKMNGRSIEVYDLAATKPLRTLGVPAQNPAVVKKGMEVNIGGVKMGMMVAHGTGRMDGGLWASSLAFSPVEAKLFVGSTPPSTQNFARGVRNAPIEKNNEKTISVWDASTGTKTMEFGKGEAVRHLAVSGDGRTVAAASGTDGKVSLWEAASGRERGTLSIPVGRVTALRFDSASGRLATGSSDTTLLLWDLPSAFAAGATLPADAKEWDKLWLDLGGEDAERAFRIVALLQRHPKQALAFLKERLNGARGLTPARLDALTAQLDHDEFAERAKATSELTAHVDEAAPALRTKLAEGKVTLEMRKRIEQILASEKLSPWSRQVERGLEIVERLRTEEARALLAELARNEHSTLLSNRARGSLERAAKHLK